MPNWKKVIVSGSNVSQLFNDGVYLRTTGDGVISSSAQLATQISGAFTATSAAFDGRISSLSSSSTTFAGTGSNTFKGDQTFSGSLLPETTEVFSLGSPDKVWESLYVDGQSIYMKDVATNTFVTMSANAGVLTFNNTRLNVPLGITSSNLILTSIVNAGTDTDKFLVLDTNGNVDFRTGTEILSDIGGQGLSAGTVSSSAQIQAYDIFLEKLGDNVISSSAQLTTEFDTRYLNTSGDGVISSSAQVDHDSTTNFVANEHIDHTTVSISAGSGLSGGGTIASTRTLTLDTSSVHFTDGVKTKLNTEGVISSSAQLTIEFDTRYLNTSGDGVISSSAQIATDISGAFTAASGGFSTRITSLEAAGGTTFSSSVSTRLTNVEGYTLDNVTDNGSSTTNVITVGGLTVNGNATITGTLTAQQFNTEFVSSSIIFESGSTKFGDSIDDIHSFTGSVKLNTQTAATTDTDKFLVFDTGGEIKYRTGAEVLGDINPGGLVSSSAQLTTEFDTRYLNTTGDGVISSSAQIASDISGAFTGAGFVDTTGTPSNTQIAFFSDSNTIQGSSNLTISGSGTPTRILVLDGLFHSTGSVGLNGFVAISGSSSNSSSRIGITAAADEGLLYSGNTAEVKSTIRLSNFYTDGYSIGRFITPGATNTLRIGPDVILLGKLSVTGSLSISGSTLISSSAQIASDISGAFSGAGFVDVGTGASGSRLAIWQDGNTIKGHISASFYENYNPILNIGGVWDDTNQSGIQSKTIQTEGLYVAPSVGVGDFTSSIVLSANRGPIGWYVQTQLNSFNFATAPTNQVIHSTVGYSAFISYWVSGYQGYRSGQIVISVAPGGPAVHTEFSTVSIGNTSDVEFSVDSTGTLFITAGGATEGTLEIKSFLSS